MTTQHVISPWIEHIFSQWLNDRAATEALSTLAPVRIEEFDTIYRLGVKDTLRFTASLSPHLETLRRLLDLVDPIE